MKKITRRAALRGTAAVATCAVAGTAAAASTQDVELLALYRRWRARCRQVDHYIKTTDDVSDEKFDALCNPLLDMEYEIATTPARTLRGIAAKFRAYVATAYDPPTFLNQDPDHLWGHDHEQAYIASIYRDLERLVGEG